MKGVFRLDGWQLINLCFLTSELDKMSVTSWRCCCTMFCASACDHNGLLSLVPAVSGVGCGPSDCLCPVARKREKSVTLGVVTGASVSRGSPGALCCPFSEVALL